MMDRVDVVIVGAGVLGCAVAQRLGGRGLSVMLLEAASKEGTGLTSRNSGVVHSGLYYAPESLKAAMCLEGQERLYRWCETHAVPVQRCGKLVLGARDDGGRALEDLAANAARCGATGLRQVSHSEAVALEPRLAASRSDGALWCPKTGIVDAHSLTHSLRVAAASGGVDAVFNARVEAVRFPGDCWVLETTRGTVEASLFVNAAGLAADQLAVLSGLTGYHHRLSRGDYFRWHGAPVFSRLVYPVRRSGAAGLGVHVTLEIDGSIRLGPDAKWVGKDGVQSPPEQLASRFREHAIALLGEFSGGWLSWDGCGVRPKLFTDHGEAVDDFVVARHQETSWHLLGVESPGLTAALALGARVAEEVAAAKP